FALVRDLRRVLRLQYEARMTNALALADQLFAASTIALITTRQRAIEQTNASAVQLLTERGPVTAAGRILCFQDARAQAGFETLSRGESEAASPSRVLAFVAPDHTKGETWLAQIIRLDGPRDVSLLTPSGGAPLVLSALTPLHAVAETREWSIAGF